MHWLVLAGVRVIEMKVAEWYDLLFILFSCLLLYRKKSNYILFIIGPCLLL